LNSKSKFIHHFCCCPPHPPCPSGFCVGCHHGERGSWRSPPLQER